MYMDSKIKMIDFSNEKLLWISQYFVDLKERSAFLLFCCYCFAFIQLGCSYSIDQGDYLFGEVNLSPKDFFLLVCSQNAFHYQVEYQLKMFSHCNLLLFYLLLHLLLLHLLDCSLFRSSHYSLQLCYYCNYYFVPF